jgi:hypothetical protein
MDKLDIKIDKAVLHNTTNCKFDFSCLSGDKACLCDVIASNEDDIVEVKPNLEIACKYRIKLDSANYCHCPTRTEIYNRYGI